MARKILIIVLSSDFEPYVSLMECSMRTWDSVECDNVETVYICSESLTGKTDTDKVKYFPIDNDLYNIGRKVVAGFEWALENKDFDFIARVNASCYCDKKRLIEFVSTLPEENIFAGVEVAAKPRWMFGGCHFIISKDVVKKIVENKSQWDNRKMEDESMSQLVDRLGIPYTKGKACSIDKQENGWLCLSYNAETILFENFEDVKRIGHHFYRVKQDLEREKDIYVMEQLYNVLK